MTQYLKSMLKIPRKGYLGIKTVNLRYLSTTSVRLADEFLPPPASLVPSEQDVTSLIDPLVEPTLASLGLCSYWPPGWIQSYFEILHINIGMPWWLSIFVGSISIRILTLPMAYYSQKYGAKRRLLFPYTQYFITKGTQARSIEEVLEFAGDFKKFCHDNKMSQRDFSSILNLLPVSPLVFINGFIYISSFRAIRGMVQLPVESLQTGGLLWMPNLTLADPYFVLPIVSSALVALGIKLGSEGLHMELSTRMMIGLPVVSCIFFSAFSAALQLTIIGSVGLGLVNSAVLRLPYFADQLKVVEPVVSTRLKRMAGQDPDQYTGRTGGGYVAGISLAIEKIRKLFRRNKVNIPEMEKQSIKNWELVGRSPVKQTFTFNPKLPENQSLLTGEQKKWDDARKSLESEERQEAVLYDKLDKKKR